jgi:ABC-type polysaccharide/polyol phosphate export permease
VIQFSRAVLVDHAIPTFRAHLLLGMETAVILAIGILIFRRYSPFVAEYL